MGKKRFKKGAESLRKIIAIHRNIKLKRAQAEGNIELVLYYEKEIKSLEAELAKKQMKLLPRSKRIQSKKRK